MATFMGSLNSNEIYGGLFNMIISQTVFDNGLDVDDFVSKFRVDGSMYGDTKLYYSADVLASYEWGNDTEAANLLAIKRAPAPDVQAITINKFRQIALTLDDYMSKRAWATEGAFAEFNGVLLSMLQGTKQVIDYTTLATYIGTAKATAGKQEAKIGANPSAQTIAQHIADILVDIKRPSREYNDHGNMRAVAPSKLMFVWNAKYLNQIRKLDMPTIFNAEMVDAINGDVLPPEYFGEVKTGAVTVSATDATNKKYRFLMEMDKDDVHYFAGDVAPAGSYNANELYEVKDDIICKIMAKDSVPYMSGFEVGTSFFNAKSLTTNHYLTWGRNTLEYLKDKPFVTVEARA